jgi:DNA-binding Lrp family transcriptional regulator
MAAKSASVGRRRDLDEIDRRLLGVLQEQGRIPVNELAAATNVSRATAYSRFERLQRSGAIRGFHADIDPGALGYGVAAMVLVNIEQGAWATARGELASVPGVEYLALTSGEFDFVLLVRAPDVAALRDVILVRLQSMREIRSTHTVFVLDEQHFRPASDAFAGPSATTGGGRRSSDR